MFDKLLKNKTVQNAFLNQFKEIIVKENLKSILIEIKEDGSFEPVLFKEPVKVLTVTEYEKLIHTINSQL